MLQTYPQGSVRQFYQTDPAKKDTAPALFVMNLSVPGFTLADSVTLRPQAPVVHRNMKQTVVNLILGFPHLFLDNVPIWNQFEYAKALFPTVALVELGYYEALDAAVSGDPRRLPDPAAFGSTYKSVLSGLRGLQAQVIATTIPNPMDTAYFSSPATAAAITATIPFVITAGYGVTNQDYITRNGLMAMANQFTDKQIGPLPAGSIMTAAVAADLTTRVNALNAQIVTAAKDTGAVLYDLNAFLHKIKVSGAVVNGRTLTADYLGGFYSMDAVYPGAHRTCVDRQRYPYIPQRDVSGVLSVDQCRDGRCQRPVAECGDTQGRSSHAVVARIVRRGKCSREYSMKIIDPAFYLLTACNDDRHGYGRCAHLHFRQTAGAVETAARSGSDAARESRRQFLRRPVARGRLFLRRSTGVSGKHPHGRSQVWHLRQPTVRGRGHDRQPFEGQHYHPVLSHQFDHSPLHRHSACTDGR